MYAVVYVDYILQTTRRITDVSHKMLYMIMFVLRNITDMLMILSHNHLIHAQQ